ncbi:MAG: hypothetical protein HQK79_20575 [Desulfobacterales bacterium]|nr:hypothetical protein [Desulfobacterales bacterium]MBF0398187.1 hypothetical protein [Desulfobacterales bacterium]
MQAIKVSKFLDSETINIPEIKTIIGKHVEIIILFEPQSSENGYHIHKQRKPGSAKGLIKISDDFHEPLNDEMLEEFYK